MIKKVQEFFDSFSEKAYRNLLKVIPLYFAHGQEKLAPGSSCNFTYVTLCGRSHIPMLRESLLSLVRNWTVVPPIIIYTDGSVDVNVLKIEFKWLEPKLQVKHWKECLREIDPITERNVIDFACKHVMGKKFAIILSNGRKQPSFWCDADVLWFADFNINSIQAKSFQIIASADYQPSYSKNLLPFYPNLLAAPYVCAGMVFINGDIMSKVDLSKMLEVALNEPDHFSEQTMVARTVVETGGKLWADDDIVCFESDKGSFMPTYINKSWVARHYVSPVRHLFWRDAFFKRLTPPAKVKSSINAGIKQV